MSLLGFCQWLEQTRGSIALHESLWASDWRINPCAHIALFVGKAVMLDLHLLGVRMRRAPVSEVAERLLPWTAAGFCVMFVRSCSMLFRCGPNLNIFFRVKVAILILAGLNARVFQFIVSG